MGVLGTCELGGVRWWLVGAGGVGQVLDGGWWVLRVLGRS